MIYCKDNFYPVTHTKKTLLKINFNGTNKRKNKALKSYLQTKNK